jgi:N-carbamoylputrescine amidase
MDGVYFNSCAVIDADGTYMGKTRKMHIPEGPQYIEKFYFTPGDLGYKVYKTKFAVIGIGICWDEWFPELSRILALKGAQILFFPSAIGSEPDNPDLDTSEPWRIAVRANGVVNNVFVGCVNRVGEEKGLYIGATDRNTNRKQPEQMTFYGRSFISGPFGEMLAEAKTKNDEIITAECDLSLIKKSRDILQFHRDRRPETYKELLKIVIEE